MRKFGRTKLTVSPVALAGSPFGAFKSPLPEVYSRGVEIGINIFFWDSNFKNMTQALLELSPERRSQLFIVASIAVGGPRQIRKGIIKKLKILKLDRFSSFQLGWVRSKFRVRQSVVDTLISLREEGLCDNIGLSIHRRKLAFELYQKNIFDIFMVRYNAAHRGLEDDFLNHLDSAVRPSVLTYTATRWRKLLNKPAGWEGEIPRPGDLYRFALSHPMVDVVCMSPFNVRELDDNMAVLSEGPLDAEEREFVRRFGDAVYSSKKTIIGDPYEKSARI